METSKLNLQSPWVLFAREVGILFGPDPEVEVEFDAEAPKLGLRVENPTKAEAIQALLGESRRFGNVELPIDVIPANAGEDRAALLRLALSGNPVFAGIAEADGSYGLEAAYCMFEPEAVQYATDDLSSAYGVRTCVYEDVARDVLGEEGGVFICSELIR